MIEMLVNHLNQAFWTRLFCIELVRATKRLLRFSSPTTFTASPTRSPSATQRVCNGVWSALGQKSRFEWCVNAGSSEHRRHHRRIREHLDGRTEGPRARRFIRSNSFARFRPSTAVSWSTPEPRSWDLGKKWLLSLS